MLRGDLVARMHVVRASGPPVSSCHGRRHHITRCAAAASSPAAKKNAARKPLQPDPIAPDSLFSADSGVQTLQNDIIGPIAVVNEQGRRSVVATRTLTSGELLLITNNIVIQRNSDVYPEQEGEEEEEAELDENAHLIALLEDLKTRRYSQRELNWLQLLRRGGAASSEAVDLAAIQQMDDQDKSSPLPDTFTDDVLQDIVKTQTLVTIAEDVGITSLTGLEQSPGIVGLWPHHALLNHSCAPSTVNYIVAGKAIARAARPGLLRNSELTRTVLFNLVTMPLKARRDYLQSEYGFKCMCVRCKAEEVVAPELQDMVFDIYESVGALREDLETIMETQDEAKLSSATEQLAAYAQTLDAAFERYKPLEQTQIYLQASAFDMYELLFTCLSATEQYEPRLTELLAALSGAVSPGSEQHVYWAYMNLRQMEEVCTLHVMEEQKSEELTPAIQAKARQMSEYKDADANCFKANCARYGRITPPMYRKILGNLQQLEQQRMEQMEQMALEQQGADGEGGEQEAGDGDDDSNVVDVKSEDVTPRAASTAP